MYKYSLFKYAKSWSTWIILAITMVIVIMIAGYLPFHFITKMKNNPQVYSKVALIIISSTTTFVAIFTSVFSGFKSASMYRDEIEDGSLLVMLSKPITRKKLLLSKWLGLQTAIMIYTFITAITFLVTVEISDRGNHGNLALTGTDSLKSKIFQITFFMWIVIEVLAMIFSSIGLLVSSKFSIGVSAGICIGLGVIIPITSIIGTFASKNDYDDISSRHQTVDSLVNKKEIPGINLNDLPVEAQDVYKNLPDLKNGTPYKLGMATGDKDSFKWMQVFDLSFQVQKLSEFASEQIISSDNRNSIHFDGASGTVYKQAAVQKTGEFTSGSKNEQINILNKMILDAWGKTHDYRSVIMIKAFDFIANYNWDKEIDLDSQLWMNYFGIRKLNNSTKSIFDIKDLYSWIFNRTPISDAIQAKYSPSALKFYETLFATNDEANTYMKKNQSFDWQYSSVIAMTLDLFDNVGVDNETFKISNVYPDLGHENSPSYPIFSAATQILRPIDFWVDSSHFRNVRIKSEYAFDPQATLFNMNNDSEISGTGFLDETILRSKWDAMGYYELTSAINAGKELALVKHVEYSNKYTILLIYLALGLLLLPATYLVIRKQDFR